MSKVTIKSDGTPGGTIVLVDGKQLETTHVVVTMGVDQLARAEITLWADEVEIDAPAEVVLK